MPNTDRASAPASLPLLLLLRVNLLQSWRKLLAVREKSRLMVSVIGAFIVGYLVLAFFLFYYGLNFIAQFPGLGAVLTERLLYLLFAILFGLLLLSNLVIGYTNMFRNRETEFLLTMPLSENTVFRWKFIESVLLASWAFLFLIAPLLAAFGITRGVPWHFYVVTTVLTGLLIIVPGAIGSWIAIHLARYLDRRNFQVFLLATGVILLGLVAFAWKTQAPSEEMLESRVLVVIDQLLGRTRFALFPFLPSYQLTTGILHLTEGAVSLAAFYLAALMSNILFFGYLALTRFGRIFRASASEVHSRGRALGSWGWLFFWRRQARGLASRTVLDRCFDGLFWLRADTRALLLKDVRLFWRDTTQWGQTVVLFGLLGAYILNLRNFTHQLDNPFWVSLVAYLNLGTCSLTLATLTTRFVFPQFSLEGQRLWIVGLAPMGLWRVVTIKYWLASSASLVITLGLVTLSCRLLKMDWSMVALFGAVITVMTLSLNGLATGLGVLYPNFRDPNPGKIVSGFGGTLCLVLSFVYILVSVLLLALGTGGFRTESNWIIVSQMIFVLVSVGTGALPIGLARRRVRTLEV